MTSLKWYWGDLHNHCGISYGHGSLTRALAIARQQLDFCSVTGHAFWPDMPDDPADPSRYGPTRDYHLQGFARLRAGWPDVQRQMADARVPGTFETFLSYEWHSRADGDHHVVYCDDHAPLIGGDRVWDLKSNLQTAASNGSPPAIVIPHHIGYGAGYRGINWETFTPERSPFVEIFSLHGCAESEEAPYPMLHRMGPRDGRATASWGLRHGHRFGLVASTDHHSGYPGSYGYGRLAAAASGLSREALWEAFLARRVYATTGDRIGLDFRLNDSMMGAEVVNSTADGKRHIAVNVQGRGPLDYVELLQNERIIRRWPGVDPLQAREYATAAGGRPVRAFVRVEWGWGPSTQEWECRLELSDGHLVGVETCFAGPAVVAPQDDYTEDEGLLHELVERSDRSCAWRSQTEPNPTVRHPATQALIAEVEMSPGAEIVLHANGKRYEHTLADLLDTSHSHFLRGWRSEAVLFHRAMPVDLCRVEETVEDAATSEGDAHRAADCYRVRVAQRNGQWAWSTPIWVIGG